MTSAVLLEQFAAELRGGLDGDWGRVGDGDLLALMAAWEQVGRLVDAARVRVAGEVAVRSRPELGDEGLSRGQNFTSPAALVATVTGASARECRARLALGSRLRGPMLLGGLTGPDPLPAVSGALDAGSIGVETAAVIARVCGELTDRGLGPVELGCAEQTLVDETITRHLTADQTGKLAIRLREVLDPDGAEPRDERHQQQRSLTIAQSSDGMIRGRFALTPEQGGIWLSTLQAMHSPRITAPRFVTEDEFVTQTVIADTRTTVQRNVDTITELLAHATGSADMPRLNGATTTVNVHIALADLEAGRGVGWIDGVDEPVPAATIAQLRCHSPLAVTVFGDGGEILHHGKTRRLFTPAQNRALAARDGGCVWPDCDRPPSFCETHHADEWVSDDHPPGRTDIDNGVLLCHFHHSHLHRTPWRLVMLTGTPHIVPPAWIDPTQTPIPTTRRRVGAPALRPAA